MRRMLTAKLQNRSGVLNRFTGVLSRRQVNIESISVGASEDPNVSRITIIIDVNSQNEVEQIIKQLNRQIDVIRIRDITDQPHLEREVILVKVSAPTSKRAEILPGRIWRSRNTFFVLIPGTGINPSPTISTIPGAKPILRNSS